MRLLTVLAVIGLALGWPSTSSPQTGQPTPTNMAMRVTAARKANAALMRQYSWTSRTEVIDQGQVKDLIPRISLPASFRWAAALYHASFAGMRVGAKSLSARREVA